MKKNQVKIILKLTNTYHPHWGYRIADQWHRIIAIVLTIQKEHIDWDIYLQSINSERYTTIKSYYGNMHTMQRKKQNHQKETHREINAVAPIIICRVICSQVGSIGTPQSVDLRAREREKNVANRP